jgi:hypothetical protein
MNVAIVGCGHVMFDHVFLGRACVWLGLYEADLLSSFFENDDVRVLSRRWMHVCACAQDVA